MIKNKRRYGMKTRRKEKKKPTEEQKKSMYSLQPAPPAPIQPVVWSLCLVDP